MSSATPGAETPPHHSFLRRVQGALLLEGSIYEEIENDRRAMPWAAAVVVIAGAARGVSAQAPSTMQEVVGSALSGVCMWLVAALLVWGIGVKRTGYTSNYPELLRTIGFAAAPLLLLLLRLIPMGPADQLVWVVAHVWALLSLIVAMREALDVSDSAATLVCLLSLATAAAVVAGVGAVLISLPSF